MNPFVFVVVALVVLVVRGGTMAIVTDLLCSSKSAAEERGHNNLL